MSIWWLYLILASIAASGIAFIWLIHRLGKAPTETKAVGKVNLSQSAQKVADQDIEHIFNDDFREELKNRGRLHFEKIIGENAMFLQQDMRLTTSQLNEYMKTEVSKSLKQEFAKYEQSISDAKQLAIDSIQRTNVAIEEQRQQLSKQVEKEVADSKRIMLSHFQNNMTDIVNHYVIEAVGDQIDLSDQLEYIIADLEANKKAIIEDIEHGA
ncbi:MAG TPA: hypothetical protein VL989_01075 [Candidatus Sulfotelmatobacter sp.]|nr:hypothetical protein [Candidatus Sulfotelmatobacter sp.]